jgi:hypothetical protein
MSTIGGSPKSVANHGEPTSRPSSPRKGSMDPTQRERAAATAVIEGRSAVDELPVTEPSSPSCSTVSATSSRFSGTPTRKNGTSSTRSLGLRLAYQRLGRIRAQLGVEFPRFGRVVSCRRGTFPHTTRRDDMGSGRLTRPSSTQTVRVPEKPRPHVPTRVCRTTRAWYQIGIIGSWR